MSFIPPFLATGIGSLPFTHAEEATDFVLKYLPEIPHWPQMPRRTRQEHFVYQFLTPFLELGFLVIPESGYPYVKGEGMEAELVEFYERYLLAIETGEGLDFFGIPEKAGPGLYAFLERLGENGTQTPQRVKGQIAGPLSIGLTLTDEGRRPIFYHPQLKDMLIKILALNALWQAKQLKKIAPPLVFIDDPAIASWGTAPHVALSREDMVMAVKEIGEQIQAEGALAGAHACAGVDWSVLMEAGLDIISFDAYYYFDSLVGFARPLQEFLERGGILAWGIVPTSEAVWQEQLETLLAKFRKQQQRLVAAGVSLELLESRTLITPSCGTGLLEVREAERVYDLTIALSDKLRRG